MAPRFHLSTLALGAWIAASAYAPFTGCAEGEELDPNFPLADGGKRGSGKGGSAQSLPTGGASGTSDPSGSGGATNETGTGGSAGSGNVADSSTPGSGGSAGQSGSAGSGGTAGAGNMPMDAAIIPPDAPLAMGIVVFYKAGDTNNMNDTIHFYLDIVNNGATDVPLGALKVRYYFADELNGAGKIACYDSNTSTYPGGQNYKQYTTVTTGTRTMITMVTGANAYLEFTASTADQLPSKSKWSLQCANSSPGGQPQDETNDYSAILTQTTSAQTTKIVVLQGTTVVAGIVPK
jgi:Cellulose binding domain